MKFRKYIFLSLFAVLLFNSNFALAANLKEIFLLAQQNDPVFFEAKETLYSALESIPQARAELLPLISGAANSTYIDANSTSSGSSTEVGNIRYNNNGYSITASQPIIAFSKWIDYKKAKDTVESAYNTYYAAEQDLIIRVAEKYFNVLKAMDDLNLASKKRKTFARDLEQSQQKFEVGLIAITDVNEAKARQDSAVAEEISAKNALEDQKEILRETIGIEIGVIQRLQKNIKLLKPNPLNLDFWAEKALEQNFELKALKLNLNSTKLDIVKKDSLHFPTLDLEGSIVNNKNVPNTDPSRIITKKVGVKLTVPIFSGGKILSEQKQARHAYKAKFYDYQENARLIRSNAIRSYRGILTQISRINALEQSVASARSLVAATKDAYEVGTRTAIDYLNSQDDLLTAERDYFAARYDYLLETLKLKQAVGALHVEDLIYINSLLIPEKLKN